MTGWAACSGARTGSAKTSADLVALPSRPAAVPMVLVVPESLLCTP